MGRESMMSHWDGEIIFKNVATQALVDILLMDFDDMTEEIVGNKMPMYYKAKIMMAIAFLWD